MEAYDSEMSCNSPIRCWRSTVKSEAGKFPVSFSQNKAFPGLLMTLPCGHCLGCKKERSISWGIRCYHESLLYDDNLFLTLTYKHVPNNSMLCMDDFQKFMKRLRKHLDYPIRFIHCGEYGPKTLRPHYHALIFGYFPQDIQFEKLGKNGDPIYHSDEVENIWGLGKCVCGRVSFSSAQYVAKYINKEGSIKYLESVNDFIKPYNTMSRRPGLGIPWLENHWHEIYPRDRVLVDGNLYKPPKAYDRWVAERFSELWFDVRHARALKTAALDRSRSMEDTDSAGYAREIIMKGKKVSRDEC